MKKYILVLNINEYPELGGGIKFHRFETIEEMNEKAIDTLKEDEHNNVLFAGEVFSEVEYKPFVKIVDYKPTAISIK